MFKFKNSKKTETLIKNNLITLWNTTWYRR